MPNPKQSGDEPQIGDTISGQAAILYEHVASRLEEALSKIGLGLGTFELLTAIKSGAGKATQAELAQRLGITPPSLCEAVRSAVEKGLAEQAASAGDRRSKRVLLTKRGSRVLADSMAVLEATEHELLKGIPRAQVEAAIAVLRKANQNLLRLEQKT